MTTEQLDDIEAQLHPDGCPIISIADARLLLAEARQLERMRSLIVSGFDRNTGQGSCVVILDWPFHGWLVVGGTIGQAFDAMDKNDNRDNR